MKILNVLTVLCTLVLLQSCASTKDKAIETFWVSGVKSECDAGAGKTECLVIYRSDFPTDNDREYFYDQIQGFTFKEGLMQKIKVAKESQSASTVPADASTNKYSLVEILETKSDYISLLQGDWSLIEINGSPIDKELTLPTLTIDFFNKQISGNDGCNNYNAELSKLTAKRIAFGPLASTKKMCRDMNVSSEYTAALKSLKTYRIKSNHVIFYDEQGDKVLTFMKKENKGADQRINDIWVATKIGGSPINEKKNKPRLEVNLADMRLMGNDGCNTYFADIKSISEKTIEIGGIASTQKACMNMETAIRYGEALNNSISYKVEEGTLAFFDKDKRETLFFQKTD